MSSTPDRNSIKVTGGTFNGVALGIGRTVQHGAVRVGDVAADEQLDRLRIALGDARDSIVAAAGTEKGRSELAYEVHKIEEELAEPKPDAANVRSRWAQVQKVLDPLAATTKNIAQITNLVTTLFGLG